ncbi:peptidoglycan-binding domain-containing protein [Amycolatopsis cynarae]|uniref:Peptidoglycan-binding domain-containing protein n=1 Tax=Amycolatopsis cynarae TaxID=2995223 RepID=A0ABY7B3I5_9PSEU|nr:peptidoglycan-binding domain-containing protein [Amycolatopsis sp. HUAS 11-8]WAL66874.1 peptidoglycan-binding domain-containing protein [Amycolatopsis sp. HUAS 11-8]
MTRRRKRALLVAATAAVLLAGAAVTVTALVPGGGRDAGGARTALPPGTAKVTRQTLVDTQTESGELSHGDTVTLNNRLNGTITALPLAGSTVTRGKTAYKVDDLPVVLLYGTLPSYRALSVGTEGSDVKEFEENLRALGYTGFTVDDEYTDSTAAAVKSWQKSLGLPQTGTVDLGRVVYAAGPVRVDTLKTEVGDAAQPNGALYTYTGTTPVVTVEVSTAQQQLAVKDAAVTVKRPDGRTCPARITRTETVVDTSGSGSGSGGSGGSGQGGDSSSASTKIRITVTPDDPKALDGLDAASIDVDFTASQRENVLTVPVTALLALAEGGYGVQVVEGGTTRMIAVRTGLFGGGRVEVSGAGLAEGMTVGTPS